MTLDVKARLRELLAKATPGPWRVFVCGERGADVDAGEDTIVAHAGGEHAQADAALIAAMRNLLPALLDRLERAEAIVGAVEAAYYPAHGDDVERHWYRVRSLLDDARWRDGHTRAALDDEAPR